MPLWAWLVLAFIDFLQGHLSCLRLERESSLRSCLAPRRETRIGTRHCTYQLVRQSLWLAVRAAGERRDWAVDV
jgi:hypothetical protein